MKILKSKLRQIIKEEICNLNEVNIPPGFGPPPEDVFWDEKSSGPQIIQGNQYWFINQSTGQEQRATYDPGVWATLTPTQQLNLFVPDGPFEPA